MIATLKASHNDEERHHEEAISALHGQCGKLQNRVKSIYTYKPDSAVDKAFYNDGCVLWRCEQGEILRKIEAHQDANESYIKQGIRMPGLADRAYNEYQQMPLEHTRILLRSVYSNSIWRD